MKMVSNADMGYRNRMGVGGVDTMYRVEQCVFFDGGFPAVVVLYTLALLVLGMRGSGCTANALDLERQHTLTGTSIRASL
jgi:hypothetical protein